MRSGCAADGQRAGAVVEAKKDRCANDAAPKSPQNPADAPPPPPPPAARILPKKACGGLPPPHPVSRRGRLETDILVGSK